MRYLLSSVLFCIGITCFAQDTLTNAQRTQLQQAMATSMFGYFNQAYRLAQKGDSVGATNVFVNVDPHYLLFEGITPANLDSFLKKMRITNPQKEAYTARFMQVYDAPKTDAFTQFSKMHKEDQGIRKSLEICGDSFTCARMSKRLRSADSQHFQYLYAYVQKNGWPTVANGGLYAHTLAIHDHEHHAFYIPHLQKAVLQGQAMLSALELIYYWRLHADVIDYKAYFDTVRKFSFDVSSILSLSMPASLPQILKAVKQYCPIKLHLVLEASDIQIYHDWCTKTAYPYKNNHIVGQFFNEIFVSCPIRTHKGESVYKNTSSLKFLPYEGKRPRMMLYVIY